MPRVLLAAVAALVVLSAQGAHGGPLAVPCETLTRLDYCAECAKPAGAAAQLCYLCHPTRASVWKTDGTGTVSQCKAPTSSGATCASASADTNCALCDGIYCIACKPGFTFGTNAKCQASAWNNLTGCRALSKNAGCASCTADGACTLCTTTTSIVVPLNAIYINAAGQGSTCMTTTKVQTESKAITGTAAVLPAGCKEVDTEFKCIRCANTHSLTGGKCVLLASGSKCKTTLPYWQYCAQCDATGTKCLSCNGSRSPPTGVTDGRCALPCKQLFGIGCKTCNQTKCLTTDPKYAQGRK